MSAQSVRLTNYEYSTNSMAEINAKTLESAERPVDENLSNT